MTAADICEINTAYRCQGTVIRATSSGTVFIYRSLALGEFEHVEII
jgi:hypothetical protein